MTTDRKRDPQPDAAQSLFGESRFGPSRFGPSRMGSWVEEGPEDAQGRVSGWYRTGEGEGAVTGLTVVKPQLRLENRTPPVPSPSPPVPKAPSPNLVKAEPPAGTKALNLPGGRHGVLLFHGLSSTPLELQFLARGLHRAGHTVRIAVIEGYSHGLPSAAPSGHAEWAEAAVAEFDRMKQGCDTVAVGGLCIGALLSLYVAGKRPDAVSHVLALSTTLHYDGWAAPWTRWMLPLARVLTWSKRFAVKEREPFGLKDERLRAWIAAQMKESGGSDAGAAVLRVGDLLEAQNLMRLVRHGMKQIKAPTLLIHARDDDCATPRSAFEVASSVSSERVHFVLLKDSYHMISIDKEKARVLTEMKDFLQGVVRGADASPSLAAKPLVPTPMRSSEHVRA